MAKKAKKAKKVVSIGAKKKAPRPATTKAPAVPKSERPTPLPGMEDRAIQEIENVALTYADVRDQRMRLGQREVDLKNDLLALMKKHGKEEYVRNGLEIRVIHTDETVKVRVKKGDEDGE